MDTWIKGYRDLGIYEMDRNTDRKDFLNLI